MLKPLFSLSLVMVLTLGLAGCGSNGGGGGSPAAGPAKPAGKRTIFSNPWRGDLANGGGFLVISFTPNSIEVTNHCIGGLKATLKVAASVNENTVQILEAKKEETVVGDQKCSVDTSVVTLPYVINEKGNLVADGAELVPYQ